MDEIAVLPPETDIATAISHIIERETRKDPCFEDPFLLVDLGDVYKKLERWRTALPRVEPFYAVKCNDDPVIIRILAKLRACFDCASKEEMELVLGAAVDPSRIVFSHSVKRTEYLKYAAEKGVDLMVYDNEYELIKIKKTFPNARLLLRIRPQVSPREVEHSLNVQFGCTYSQAEFLLRRARELDLAVVGVHFHVGSGIRDGRVFHQAVKLSDKIFSLAKTLGFSFSILDVGGGYNGHKTPPVSFEEVAQHLKEALDMYFPAERGVRIIAEPGRYIATSAATLAITIIGKRVDHADTENETDNSLRDSNNYFYFMNEGRHGAISRAFTKMCKATEPLLLTPRQGDVKVCNSSLWGPSCNSVDCIFEHCLLPELDIGEWLYIENMGAYTISQIRGASFNGMPHARSFYTCTEDCWSNIGGRQIDVVNGVQNQLNSKHN